MHRVLIQIGPVTIYSYGFFIAAAFLACVLLIRRDARKFQEFTERRAVPFDKLLDALVWALIGGIIGGRLLFVLINWQYYLEHPLRIFVLREGGMAFQGSLIAAILAGGLTCRLRGISFRKASDLVAPYIALGQAIGRIGCFFNGCCYGRIIGKGLGVIFPGEPYMRIPVQIYSSLCLVFLYLFLVFLRDKAFLQKKHACGSVFCMYLILYSAFRFFIDFLRGDNPQVFSIFTLAQLISVGIFLAGIIMLRVLQIKNQQ